MLVARAYNTVHPLGQILAKNADNVKAKFRKGKALGELGFFEKANAMLEDLLKNNEQGPGMSHQRCTRPGDYSQAPPRCSCD